MHFEIVESENKQFFFRIVADNGKTLCHSETYTTKENVKKAIAVIKDGVSHAEIVDLTNQKKSVWGFYLDKK